MSRTCYPVLSSQRPCVSLHLLPAVPCSCSVLSPELQCLVTMNGADTCFAAAPPQQTHSPFTAALLLTGSLKVVFQEILDINSHSILTDSFLPSCSVDNLWMFRFDKAWPLMLRGFLITTGGDRVDTVSSRHVSDVWQCSEVAMKTLRC